MLVMRLNYKRMEVGEISYIIGYDKKMLDTMKISMDAVKSDTTLDEIKQSAKEEGYHVEEYEDDYTYGFKAYKQVSNIQNDFKMRKDSTIEDAIQYEGNIFKTRFSQNAMLNLSDLTQGSGQDAIATALLEQMKISYKIELPIQVGEHNADTVSEDGKVLQWNLEAGETNEIRFIAEEDQTTMVMGMIIAGAVFIILVVIMLLRKKFKKKSKRAK